MHRIFKPIMFLFFLFFFQNAVSVSVLQAQSQPLVLKSSSPIVSSAKEAMIAYFKEQYSDAEIQFEKIVRTYPEFTTAYIYLADSQLYQGKTELAYQNYQKAYQLLKNKLEMRKQIFPDLHNPIIYTDIVYCLNALGRYEEAKKMGLWGTIEGSTPDLYVNLGYTFHKLGKETVAESNFCKYKTFSNPREVSNIYYQRINRLFENRSWSVACPDDQKKKVQGPIMHLL